MNLYLIVQVLLIMVIVMRGLEGTGLGRPFYLQSVHRRNLLTVHFPQGLFKAARDLEHVRQGQRLDYDWPNFAVSQKGIICQIGPLAGQVKSP